MNEAWMVTYYNAADAGFGYDPGPQMVAGNLTREAAKSYARHLNKTALYFEVYSAEPEPERWT
jgi:hypothetical protein